MMTGRRLMDLSLFIIIIPKGRLFIQKKIIYIHIRHVIVRELPGIWIKVLL